MDEEKVKEEWLKLLDKSILDDLNSSFWTKRKDGLEKICKIISGLPNEFDFEHEIYLLGMHYHNYFKENNFQIVQFIFEMMIDLIPRLINANLKVIILVLPLILKHINNKKLSQLSKKCLNLLISNCSPSFCLGNLFIQLDGLKNPKLLIECIHILETVIWEYPYNLIPFKLIETFIDSQIENRNTDVKKGCIKLFATIKLIEDEDCSRESFESLTKKISKPLEKQLNELKSFNMSYYPYKQVNPNLFKPITTDGEDKNRNENDHNSEKEAQDNFGVTIKLNRKITNDLMQDLNSSKWPKKSKALNNLKSIFKELEPNQKVDPSGLETLFNTIEISLNDNNKKFLALLLEFVIILIDTLQDNFKNYAILLSPQIIKLLSDRTKKITNLIFQFFSKTIHLYEIDLIMEPLLEFMLQTNSTGMENSCKVLFTNFVKINFSNEFKIDQLCGILFKYLENKTSSVRKISQNLLLKLSKKFGKRNIIQIAKETEFKNLDLIETLFNEKNSKNKKRKKTIKEQKCQIEKNKINSFIK